MKQYTNSIRSSADIRNLGNQRTSTKQDLEKLMDISFHFELTLEQQSKLDEALEKGHIMTLEDIKKMLSPSNTNKENLINWLKSNNYKNVSESSDGRDIYASSTADNISNTLNCKMTSVDIGNEVFVGAETSPELPITLAGIHSINGLQPFFQVQKKSRKIDEIRNYKKQTLKPNALNHTLPYKVNSLRTAYNGLNIYTGLNQTIGILIDSFPNNSDMIKFWTANSVSTNINRISKINVRNVRIPSPSGEESLDTQWTSGIAPQSNIRIYASGNLYFSSLNVCLDRMISDASKDPTFRIISISLGIGEKMISNGEMNTQNSKYQTLRLLGFNIFVSSGDGGSNPYGMLQTEFPACNPNVVSVGGTTININSTSGLRTLETAWPGSGGGLSTVYTKPGFQSVVSGTTRVVPDVSCPADPNTGAYVVLANKIYQFGGTSWSAPVWAGICALINDARVRSGKSRIGFLPNYIYSMIGSNRFFDITVGSNGAYSSSVGYDRVTGIGTPNINNLINALIAVP